MFVRIEGNRVETCPISEPRAAQESLPRRAEYPRTADSAKEELSDHVH
jgi:hypothetical protein